MIAVSKFMWTKDNRTRSELILSYLLDSAHAMHCLIKFFDVNYINLYKVLQLVRTHFKIKFNTKFM